MTDGQCSLVESWLPLLVIAAGGFRMLHPSNLAHSSTHSHIVYFIWLAVVAYIRARAAQRSRPPARIFLVQGDAVSAIDGTWLWPRLFACGALFGFGVLLGALLGASLGVGGRLLYDWCRSSPL